MEDEAVARTQAPALNLTYPPFREPDFEVAAIQGSSLAGLIALELKKCPRDMPQRLLQEAESLAKFRIPNERLIGFIGNSGAGKSSSLNSVLDQDGLAKAGAIGSAVTPFAAEYRIKQDRHHAAFTMECQLMSKRELGEYVGTLLRDFWRASPSEGVDGETGDPKIYESRKAALDVFEAAFGAMDEYDAEVFEHGDDEESRQQAADHLGDCCRQLQFPDDMKEDGTWIREAADAEECQEHQSTLQDLGLWPFVKSLSIFSNIGILSRGLTLVDLPGFNDTNLARIRAARKAQSKCDDLCLVVDISRACDLPIIQQNLELIQAKAEAQHAAHVNVTIICTRSAADLRGNRALEKLIGGDKLKKSKDEIQKAKKEGDKAKQSAAERRLEMLMITTRNDRVEKDLDRKYGSHMQNGTLKVFCIDNLMYWTAETEEEKQLSGIPALRQHLEDLPAEPLFKATDLFLAKKIPALLASFGTWVDSCRIDLELEQRPRLPEAAELKACHEALADWATKMHAVFEGCINAPLEAGTAKICLACRSVAKSWEKWPAASIGSWARNDGTYRTGAMGPRCWNKELLNCFNEEVMGTSWHDFEVQVDPFLKTLQTHVSECLQIYIEQCHELQAPPNFEKSLEHRQDILLITLGNAERMYMKGAGKMRLDANSAHQDSLIVNCMLETYQEVRTAPSGSGVTKRRHGILQDHVSSPEFVDDFRSRLFEEFREVINKISTTIKTALNETIEAIEGDLEAIQPGKGREKLFKFDPNYGMACEKTLSKAHTQMEEIDQLATTARAMAQKQYD